MWIQRDIFIGQASTGFHSRFSIALFVCLFHSIPPNFALFHSPSFSPHFTFSLIRTFLVFTCFGLSRSMFSLAVGREGVASESKRIIEIRSFPSPQREHSDAVFSGSHSPDATKPPSA